MCKSRFSLEDQGFRSVYKYVDNSWEVWVILMVIHRGDFRRGLHKNGDRSVPQGIHSLYTGYPQKNVHNY